MGWTTKACCDVCGAVKGEANKWLLVPSSEHYGTPETPHFIVFHWNENMSHDRGTKLVCGESCLMRLLQPFLDSRTNPIPSTIPTNEGSTNADIEVSTDAEAVAAAPYTFISDDSLR